MVLPRSSATELMPLLVPTMTPVPLVAVWAMTLIGWVCAFATIAMVRPVQATSMLPVSSAVTWSAGAV